MRTFYISLSNFFFIIFFICFTGKINSQVTEDWTHRYTGPEASTDTPSKFVLDASGNYYLTGQSALGGGYSDIITVKFNSAGVRQWIAKYNGTADQHDNGNAVQVDNAGNVYVIGSSSVPLQNLNLIVIKYNSSGVQQWAQLYNGPANFVDVGIDLTIDAAGNIYASGYSNGIGTAFDFVLMKLNSSGTSQWSRRWNGASNSDDYLFGIEQASNGDIIVAGTSYDNSSSFNFATLRYNTSGDTLWSKKYNGPASQDDHVSDIQIDPQNNVYVCGKSQGIGSSFDYALIKYNFAGEQQWVSRYNGPSSLDESPVSMDIDKNGNIFVTGYSNNGNTTYFDYATVKYNSGGIQQWVSIYDGAESYYDYAIDLITDESGNVFVTGQCLRASDGTNDIVTLKYSSTGSKVWDKTYNGPGNLDDDPVQIGIDKSGSLLVIANSYSYFFSIMCGASDYLALKYDAEGNVEYETRFDGSGQGIDEAASMFIDNNENCYVTGLSFDNVTDLDYATIKYNSDGAPLWAMRYDGGFGKDRSSSVAADNNGNVYVTGTSNGAGGNEDIVTIKYNPDGIQQWEKRYNGAANGDDIAMGLVTDISGNTFITGYSQGAGSGKDFVTIKYSSAGIQQWEKRFNGSGNSNDHANSITLDAAGNSYVTGKSTGASSLQDIVTLKYNPSGVQQWASVYNGSVNDSDEANCISLDQSGNVMVAGKSKTGPANFDFITIKYNSSGAQQWARTYSGTSINSNDEVISVSSDNNGNIIIGGNVQNLNSGYDLATVKYNPAGNQQWASGHNGTAGADDKLSSLCTDHYGNVFAAGFTNDIREGLNFLTIKYDGNGKFIWSKDFNYIDNDTDKATNVEVDISGNVYVTGISTSIESKKDFFTVRYSQGKTVALKSLIEGFYNEVNNTMVSDTAKLYLRNASAPYNLADSSVAILNSAGNGNFIFSNVQENVSYYIVFTHRNSIETWSSSGNIFQSNVLNYDFTTSSSQAFGNNLKQKGSKFCVYSGDAVNDGIVDLTDLIFIYNASSVFTTGHHNADVNGDEITDLTDLIITYNNSSVFVSVIRP